MQILRAPCALLLAVVALAGCDSPKPRTPPAPPAAATGGEQPAPVRQIPADAAGTPTVPAWAQTLIGKTVTEAFPKTAKCIGNTDIVQKTYAGQPAGVQVHGWGWDPVKNAKVDRILLLDKDMRVIGAGAGGVARPDVAAAGVGVTAPDTGWNADAPVTAGPILGYGVISDDTVCNLGRVDF